MDRIDLHRGDELERLASFTHGALAALHTLGIFYHLAARPRTQRRYFYASVHASVLVFDLIAARRHG